MPPRTGIGNSQPEVCQCNRNGVARTSFDCLCSTSHGFMPLSARWFFRPAMPTTCCRKQPLRFGRSMRRIRAGTDFLAWALQTAHYHVLSFRRGAAKVPLQCDQFIDAVGDGHHGGRDRPGRVQALVHKCLDRLPLADRDLLRLRCQPGVSIKNVAEKLGQPLLTVYHAISRIRQVLAECVTQAMTREDCSVGPIPAPTAKRK